VVAMLSSMILLSSCNQDQTDVISTPQASIYPDMTPLLSPGNLPIAETSSSGGQIASLSLDTSVKLSADGWVRHTFSNGEKLLYRNTNGEAMYGDVAYAESKDMPRYVKMIEDRLAESKKLSTQSIGLNPNGCTIRLLFCAYSTSNYLWSNRTLSYSFEGFTEIQIAKLTPQITELNVSPVPFLLYRNTSVNKSDIIIKATGLSGFCGRAHVGFQPSAFIQNDILISLSNGDSCVDASSGTLLHELGHVFGLAHEQDRCDALDFVSPNGAEFKQRCSDDYRNYYPFDYDSIMLYESPYLYGRFFKPTLPFIGTYSYVIPRKAHYSTTDVLTIKGIYAGR
jgi:Astacin (Peptidase family M12A)